MKTLHLIILSIVASIGVFFGSNIFLPFPYGLVLGIGIPVAIIWYNIKKLKGEKMSDVFLGSKSQYIRMIPHERKIQYAIVAILVFNFASSVLYPFVNDILGLPTIYKVTDYGTSTFLEGYASPHDKDLPTFFDGVLYRSGLLALFLVFPVYLIPPALLTVPRAIFWILAIVSIFLMAKYSTGLSRRRRIAYTYLVAIQIASMWAPFFVWHPVYHHTIIPGV